MKKLKRMSIIIIKGICNVLGYVNQLIPKRNNKILIFNFTTTYQNNYAMYNYLIEHKYNERYNIYYYMPNVEKHLGKVNNVKLKFSLVGGIFCYLTIKYVFFDTGTIRIKPSKQQIVMDLWHGIPFKSVGYMSKAIKTKKPKKVIPTSSKMIVPGENMKDVYQKSFLLKDEQIYYGGQPRNDLLNKDIEPFELLDIDVKDYKKIVMWMTTYRIVKNNRVLHTSNTEWSNTNLPLLVNQEIINKMDKELAKDDILLIIKHHTTGESPSVTISGTRNIRILKEDDFISKGLHLYEILGKCDALITDYSSVFIDYLLADKPIAFIVDDIDDYEENNGFNVKNPFEFMPGKHITELKELEEFFKELLEGRDDYQYKRKNISNYFNQYNYNQNCKEILKYMKIKQIK